MITALMYAVMENKKPATIAAGLYYSHMRKISSQDFEQGFCLHPFLFVVLVIPV